MLVAVRSKSTNGLPAPDQVRSDTASSL